MRSLLCLVVLAAAAPLAGGCSTAASMNRSAEAYAEVRREVFGDLERQEFGKRLQVRLPAKLAVADVTRDRWDGTAGRRVVQTVRALGEDTETWTDVVSLAILDDGNTWIGAEELRGQAAAHQADLQLLVARSEEVDETSSPLAILNLLILPAFFLPTQHDDVTITTRALVRDVRNGLVYTTFDDLREGSLVASSFGEASALKAKRDALWAECVAAMRADLARKLRALEKASAQP